MIQMLTLSTGSEFLSLRHVFFCSAISILFPVVFWHLAKVTPRVAGVTFSLYMCAMCYCVITAPACSPEGPLRLKRTVFSNLSSHQVAPICTLHRVLSHFACTRARMDNVTKIPRPIGAAHGLTRQRRYGYWESERHEGKE